MENTNVVTKVEKESRKKSIKSKTVTKATPSKIEKSKTMGKKQTLTIKETVKPKGAKKLEDEKIKKSNVLPQPKPKNYTKEEKALYRKLEDAFNYVVNLTSVIEERLLDTKLIPDLTLAEVHVVEVVHKNNNKPMSVIAQKLKITVGALSIAINRLVQKEYLLRTRSETDKRVILISVTPKAIRALKAHNKFHDDILGLALDGVTIRDATKVMVMFQDVLEYYLNPEEKLKLKEKKKR